MKLVPKAFIFIVLILLASFFASRDLFKRGYFPMHDDIQVMRLYEMEKCFKDGQIPCRWVPDMGGGFGHPLFNYHQVFPYYLGMIFRMFGLSFINVAKLLFISTFFLSGLFMFFLGKEFWGNKGGLLSAIFFLFTPYRAVDVYVRGALTEIFGITFFPLILLALYKYIKEEKFGWFLLSILSLAGQFLSHNIMTILFTPFAFVWAFFWIVKFNKLRLIFKAGVIFIWSFLLSAFFTMPAFFEKNLVTMDTLTTDYYDFKNHFVTLRQLFVDRSFDYGPSRAGPVDDMSFQLGWPHWFVCLVAGGLAVLPFIKKKKEKLFERLLPVLLFLAWFFSTLMTHSKSFYLWNLLPIVRFVQFPWRFLALSMFFGSLLAGSLVCYLKKEKAALLAVAVIAIGCVAFNYQYFKPLKTLDINDENILSGEEWKRQSLTTFLDYYPIKVKEVPEALAFPVPKIASGSGEVYNFNKRSSSWSFSASFTSASAVLVPVFDFPQWKILVDGKETGYLTDDKLGLIIISLPEGEHKIEGFLQNTLLRKTANYASLASVVLLVLVSIKKTVVKKDEDKA